ncbi:hypothetical protein BO94DRAFT_146500 [Aspergillus sclerotioniger CBS 115572]|uniref:Uncharacterized protein n=1 Tax=Aspergillus sclerotioniger CBS 115572 TaxID=1450535 RepID=A0A317W7F8_9EURO|nr:hypothetical protein BO94DRAFT_146500 [Aspergillus sclerotioniger CBS 115572]PWY81611.1 hypothetical protein BO94DRAFT_146500 [Aspergillus sclerotioniger CBS 115572]
MYLGLKDNAMPVLGFSQPTITIHSWPEGKKRIKPKRKNIQQKGFAGGHPPNY